MKSFKEFKNISELPPKISVFPLAGALLLPRTQLPLNIFENRYLEMVDDAMSNNRLIAMIQSNKDEGDELYKTGCLGKITSYSEVANSRMLITLSGVCRFNIGQELEVVTPYRQFQLNYEKFSSDLIKGSGEEEVDREKLVESLKKYLEHNNLTIDWDAINNSSTGVLTPAAIIIAGSRPIAKATGNGAPGSGRDFMKVPTSRHSLTLKPRIFLSNTSIRLYERLPRPETGSFVTETAPVMNDPPSPLLCLGIGKTPRSTSSPVKQFSCQSASVVS